MLIHQYTSKLNLYEKKENISKGELFHLYKIFMAKAAQTVQ